MKRAMKRNGVRFDYNNSLKIEKMWGIPLFGSRQDCLLNIIGELMRAGDNKCWIATVNPEFVMAAQKDEKLAKILQSRTTLNVVDGVGLMWAKKVMKEKGWRKWGVALKVGMEILRGGHREGMITGVDLMDRLCREATERGWGVYFYGGWGDRAERTAECFLKKYPELKVTGYKDEEFDFETKTDILFVARGMGKQEKWVDESFDRLNVKLVIGVGRSFDYYSGDLKRSPGWMRRMGLEWLYSLYREPKRWKRQLALPRFIAKVMWG